MKILPTKAAVKTHCQILRKNGHSIGFVPTMGALHEGHLELVKKAVESSDKVIVSIFVNPTQFNNPEDFEKYPKTLADDLELLKSAEVDAVFVPDNQEIYSENPVLSMSFGHLEHVMEGAYRKGHFNGVGIVVSKLLNIVNPDKAFFGQKDLQQVAVVKRLVKDLSFDVEVVVVPTVRDQSGLALSSRNQRLSQDQKQTSLLLYHTLMYAKTELLKGASWLSIRAEVEKSYLQGADVRLEYFELVHAEEMHLQNGLNPGIPQSICVAAYVGEVRLIDNIPVNH